MAIQIGEKGSLNAEPNAKPGPRNRVTSYSGSTAPASSTSILERGRRGSCPRVNSRPC
jgi:hypothetical protein